MNRDRDQIPLSPKEIREIKEIEEFSEPDLTVRRAVIRELEIVIWELRRNGEYGEDGKEGGEKT